LNDDYKTIVHNLIASETPMNKSSALIALAIFFIFTINSFEIVSSQTSPQDDCPNVDGNSTKDRYGCLDSDGDGWSNPDSNWTINNGADVFINDKSQWKDFDKDGFGDNNSIGANNIDYWPNDRLRHKPVLLIACEPASNTIIISEKSSFFCKVTNPMNYISINLRIEWHPLDGISSEWYSREVTLQAYGEQGHMTMFSVDNTGEKLGLSGGEIQLWVQNQNEPSAIAKLPILVIDKHPIEQNDLAEDVGDAFSFSRMHEGVKQVSMKVEDFSGILLPTWLIYLILIVMFSLSLKKPAKIFTTNYKYKLPPKINLEKEPEEFKEPPQYVINRKVPNDNYSKNENLDSENFDYVPKRLR